MRYDEFQEAIPFYGRKLKQKIIQGALQKYNADSFDRIYFAPPFAGPRTITRIWLDLDDEYRIVCVSGEKIYDDSDLGKWNRSTSTLDGHFTAREFRWVKKCLTDVTEPEE